MWIKVVIVIVLKLSLKVDSRQGAMWEGQPGFIQVNIWITIVIIVLKPDLEVDFEKGSGHGLGGSI